ncbi:MAG: SpoIIE family protein phosphatase [Bacteroidales bacterium]|nr:SpoIIE family protein phosphatase [Bacteroidales bacterium]
MKYSILKRVFLILSFSIVAAIGTFAQKGVPYISNYELLSTMSNQNWSILQSDEDHLMYVLNRKGVYVFDGFEWSKLNINGKPIAIFSLNNLFVSTDMEIGYFKKDQKGEFNYNSIQDSTLDIYYKFLKIENDLYTCGTQHISKISMSGTPKTEPVYVEGDSTQMITDFFELNGIIYIIKDKNSVYRLEEKNATLLRLNLNKDENISFTFNHNNFSYIGTSGNRLFIFNGWEFKPITLKDQRYLNASYINGGLSLDSSRFAISTLIGGCSIINSKTLESESIINYSNGLPDDEVYSLGKDYSGGLWIAHGMGISRVDLNIPVKSFEHYSGITGNILSIAEFNRTIYVGGSEGLYYLSEVKNFSEIETPVIQRNQAKAKEEVQTKNEKQVTDTKSQPDEKDSKKKKKGFFARLFSKTDKAETQTVESPTGEGNVSKKEKEEISAAKKKMYSLQSVSNIYQRVTGVEGKCKQLLVYNSKLLAATSTGLYEIGYNKGNSILAGTYILFAKPSEFNSKNLLICSTEGVSILSNTGSNWNAKKVFSFDSEYPLSIVELSDNKLIVTTEFNIYELTVVPNGETVSKRITPSNIIVESPIVRKVLGNIKVFTSNHIYLYNQSQDALVDEGAPASNYVINAIYSQYGYSWVNVDRKWNLYSPEKEVNLDVSNYLGLFDRINDIFINSSNELLVVNGFNQIIKISATKGESNVQTFPLFLKHVTDNNGVKLDLKDIKLSYSNNSLSISLGAPSFIKEKSVQFQYIIDGKTSKWTDWSSDPVLNFPFFPSGKYKIMIKARDVLGHESSIYTLPFTIKPPLWQTPWFIGLCIIIVFSLFVFIVRYRERQLQKDKQILEEKVRERTKTIEEQKNVLEVQRDELARTNEEILQQKEEIEAQRDEIEAQNDHISKQNLEMTQSIEYAKRIQTAVMPTPDLVQSILPEHFILFKPRDIVSGDFYWMTKTDGKIIIAAADCTGHGVPGAIMSMLGISFLNEIVKVRNETKPNLILNNLRDSIKSTLSQTGKEGESKDGMDIALCTIDLDAKKIEFAGAYNPMYLIRNGELVEIKADKMPVGIHMVEKESFTHNEIEFKKDDCIYIFSDGYVSQFGGDSGRTYKSVPFKKLLAIISEKPMAKQGEMLEQEFEEWRGYNPQVDDILVIGVKFT